MKKLKIKISPLRIIKYLYLIVVICAIGALALASNFLYNNFYQSLTYSQKILTLKDSVANEVVNINLFNAVIKKIDRKTTLTEIKNINDPF